MILAAVDIGTNTLRLLVADTGPDSFREIYSDRKITRLGERLDDRGMLTREAQERTISVLAAFRKSIDLFSVAGTAAVGTSALRKADNAAGFIAAARERAGLAIEIINGEEEAELTLLGITKALRSCSAPDPSRTIEASVAIDIGGGSTEIIITGRDGSRATSLPLGAVYLTERFIKKDPPVASEMADLRELIRNKLARLDKLPAPEPGAILAGTAGTITTLTAIDQQLGEYDPDKINCSVLTRKAIDRIIDRLCSLTNAERRGIRGLEQGREDIILAGAVVCREIMDKFNFPSLVVTDWGLREGILFDLYDRMGKETRK